ncbi:MAG TPA: flagellar motor switch protein FliG [Solirubrobacteraceae bacterium]|jgi:flagellar motor switch protein FliG|nr:flagellar motor switch protein FliG [Solirubrobacteraceae bacterium]
MAIELPPATDEPLAALPLRTVARLAGRRKAAVLMAALGSERAADVMQHLREEEIESLSLEMAKMGAVEEQTTEAILGELAFAAGPDGMGDVAGGIDFAREVLERALGAERAEELLGRLNTVIEMRPFEFLRRTPPEQIVGFLRTEAPQTVALVVANLHTVLAAQVLARLPERMQPDIALRIARMGETSPAVIQQVEEVIRQKLTTVVEQEYATAGGAKALADILNHADRSTERAVLDHLTTTDQDLAEEVRRMLFVFEDIVNLDDRAIQQVLREANQKDLVLALRGVPDAVKEKLLTNMSERGAAMLQEEMEVQQPQRKRDVDAAQGRIVAVVRRLEEAGTILLSTGDEESDEDAVV